jgi:D-glycero-D-manno-heptose 1,7-bisphosphate phosphatase
VGKFGRHGKGVSGELNRAVFLDRDGVINRAIVRDGRPFSPIRLEEFELLPDVADAIVRLKSAGYRLVVVTNQPDVATGAQQRAVVEAMHDRIRSELGIEDIKVCYHVDADNCHCRKPLPGMLLEAATDYSLDLRQSFVVGDRWRDISAGHAAGCKTVMIERNYDERAAESPDAIVSSLAEAADLILSNRV